MMIQKKIKSQIRLFVLLLLFLILSFPAIKVRAAEPTAITIGKIDYEALNLQVYNNNNTIVYYSSDKKTWNELEGKYNSTDQSITMDIAWITLTSDYTLYFKGDTISTIASITLPSRNNLIKVSFDKVDGTLLFSNVEDSDTFEWRKTTDYHWTIVNFDDNSSSYKEFLILIESFRVKGAKLYLRIPQVTGTGPTKVGSRPSKELSVTISQRTNSPKIIVNTSSLTLNTTEKMEYYDVNSKNWIGCTKAMKVEDIARNVLYKYGAISANLMLRYAETEKAPYSKTAYISLPGQAAAPKIGDNSVDVTYYYQNKKLVLMFNKASAMNIYEYAVVKVGTIYNVSTVSWKPVNNAKAITLSKATAPESCKIYVRFKGTNLDTNKTIPFALSSEANNFSVTY